MKKIMFALGVALAAATMHGAAYNWQWQVTGAGTDPLTSDTATGTAYWYAFTSASDADTAQAAIIDGLRAGKTLGSIQTATDSATLNASGVMSSAKPYSLDDYSSKLYSFVVLESSDSDGNAYVLVTDYTGKSGKVTGTTPLNFGLASYDATAGVDASYLEDDEFVGGWYQTAAASSGGDPAIPEPTSGLLMLVGLGALALRRRR